MELRHIRYFVAVAEELHFAQAAERLHITPPSLTQQIQALEAELGVRLLDRTKRRVKLTDAGGRFLEEAQKTLRQAELAEHVGKQAGRGELGRIEIGYTTSSVISGVLVRILRDYHVKFPRVDPRLHRLETPRQFEYLVEGRIDAGFLRPPKRYPIGISGLDIGRYSIILALPEGHRLARERVVKCEMLAEEKFILPKVETEIGYGSYIQAIADRGGFNPKIAQRNTDYVSAIALVGACVGLAAVPSVYRRLTIAGVRYCEIDLDYEAPLAFVFRRDEKSPAVMSFIQSTRKLVRQFGGDLVSEAEGAGR